MFCLFFIFFNLSESVHVLFINNSLFEGLGNIVKQSFWLNYLGIFILFVNILPKSIAQLSEEVQVSEFSSLQIWTIQSDFPSKV
jgi:hypothetical protein